jgi:hypothetical protein
MSSEPTNYKQYLERFNENQSISGFGPGNVTVHLPCPFCAAKDFMKYELMQVEDAMKRGATCKECGRSAKAIFTYLENGKSFEVVQTDGPDQPPWLPEMRRV